MPPPAGIELGPLTRMLIERSIWSAESEFPSSQAWADDSERILAFLQAQGVLEAFLPRLLARNWDGAYAEARVGYFFKCNGFKILKWEPREVANRPGDIDVQWRETEPVFVEVKGPGWKGELSEGERTADRKSRPKYIHAEARWLDTIGSLVKAIDKAIPKFSSARVNMVATSDDLFMSALDMPRGMLEARIRRHLKEPRCACVGGVLFLCAVKPTDRPLEYRHCFVDNPDAGRPLSEEVVKGLTAGNWRHPDDK